MRAMINGHMLKVEVIDLNYNDYAAEVKILEGPFKGKCTIVEHKDFTKMTLKKLVDMVKDEMIIKFNTKEEMIETLNDTTFVEFISSDTYDMIVEEAQELVVTTEKENRILSCDTYGFGSIENGKKEILISTLEFLVVDEKMTLAQMKKIIINNIRD